MEIQKPELEQKDGYIEVELNGVRRYKNIATGELLGEEVIPTPADRLTALEAALLEVMSHV